MSISKGDVANVYEDEVFGFGDEDCYECGGERFVLNDCIESSCCCLDPEAEHGFRPCSLCTQAPEAAENTPAPQETSDGTTKPQNSSAASPELLPTQLPKEK